MKITKNYNSNLPLVLYGAGVTARGIYKMFETEGVKAVCFADKDKSKHHKQMFDDIPIMTYPIEEILSHYPECQIFVTVFSVIRYDVFHYLTEIIGVERDRILNFEEYEKRPSCKNLDGLAWIADDIRWCCNKANYADAPYIKIGDSFENAFTQFHDLRAQTIDDLRNGIPSKYCSGCGYLQEKYCGKKVAISNLSFGTVPDNFSLCNFRCFYCIGDKQNWNYNQSPECSPINVLRTLEEKELVSPFFTMISFANGELTVLPYCDAFLEASKQYMMLILTNASVYNAKIAERLSSGLTRLNVSVDAGTRETFARIKGVDAWDKVSKNLARYGEANGEIALKYIFFPGINDDQQNIDGFLNLCRKTRSKKVRLSYDYRYLIPIDDCIFEKLANFIQYFYNHGFTVDCYEEGAFPKHILDKLKKVTLV